MTDRTDNPDILRVFVQLKEDLGTEIRNGHEKTQSLIAEMETRRTEELIKQTERNATFTPMTETNKLREHYHSLANRQTKTGLSVARMEPKLDQLVSSLEALTAFMANSLTFAEVIAVRKLLTDGALELGNRMALRLETKKMVIGSLIMIVATVISTLLLAGHLKT